MFFETIAPQGLQPVPIRIRRIGKEVGEGSTAPYHCTLSGVLKFDSSSDAPNCVYDELVAMRLGVTLGAPVAAGALVAAERGDGFASLMVGAVNFKLPDLLNSQWKEAAEAFPNHAASLLAFDIFIGNIDRANNLKADMRRKNMNFFAGFDHSHCLLDCVLDVDKSLSLLGSDDLILTEHPFFQQSPIKIARVKEYVTRIQELPDSVIRSACMLGNIFRRVTVDEQEALADALCIRRDRLLEIVEKNRREIFFW
jgi:hypothetical protein